MELIVGSIVPAYTESGTTKPGLLAVTGQQLGADAVAAIGTGVRSVRLAA